MLAFGTRDIILKRRKGINHSKLNSKDAMYVSAIQEQQAIIEDLQTQINNLRGK